MEVIRVYRLSANLKQILCNYWCVYRLVPRSGRYYIQILQMGRGATHGDPVPPTIFNIVIDAVVWGKLQEVCGPQESLNGLGWAARDQDTVLYADYDCIALRNPIWVQGMLKALVQLFEQVGLYTNLGKTKSMTFIPRLLWFQIGKDAYKRQATGKGSTFCYHKL